MKATHLSGMRRQPMSQLSGDFARPSQDFRGERCQLIPVLFVARKGEHLGAQSQKLDAVSVVPPQHLDNVARVGDAERLDIPLAPRNIGGLVLVWPVLGGVLRLVWMCERMPVLND